MKITDEQQALLASLRCERLSANKENLRAVGSFCNKKNSVVADVLLNEEMKVKRN